MSFDGDIYKYPSERELRGMREDDRRANRSKRDRRAPDATLDVAPSPDMAALEAAAEQLVRDGHLQHAIALWGIALRIRMEV